MITINHLSKSFGAKQAVSDLSFTIDSGRIVGFIGPNGAGKTTTIKMITGILKPDHGTVMVSGHDMAKEPLAAKKQIALVNDTPDAFLRLKGLEYLNFIGDIFDVPTDIRKARIETLSKRFSIDQVLNDRIISYSHGMRQKIMIIGALIHDADNWILDEPLTGLDPESAYQLKEMMRSQAQSGKSVFFSTHVLEVAEKLCDEIIMINHGQLLYRGTLNDLKQRYPDFSLEQIFIEVTQHA